MDCKLGVMMFRLHGRLPPDGSYLNTFASIITNRNKFKLVHQQLKNYELFPEFVRDEKSDVRSMDYRKYGNLDHYEGRHVEALVKYTQSVACARSRTAAALAYGNRSMILFVLGLFDECVQDIDRALHLDISDLLEEKLLERRRQACHMHTLLDAYHDPIPTLVERNPQVPTFSSSLQIEENPEFGRHVVATQDIRIGDVVAIEEPRACVLLEDHWLHCHHCLKICYNLFPCPNCTQALFCSEECYHQARNTYHNYECPLLLTFSGCETLLMALRLVTLSRSTGNEDVLNLKCDEKLWRLEQVHYVTAMAAVMFHHLRNRTEIFDDDFVAIFQENIVKVLLALRLNGSRVSEYSKRAEYNYEHNFFAAGIYPFCSLFNHSCCENVNKYYFGSTMVVKAVRTIKKGEQIFLNYGFPYHVCVKDQRQMALEKEYHFKCKCEACVNDWKPHLVEFSQATNIGQSIKSKFLSADVEAAKRWLPYLIPLLEYCEMFEPLGNALTLRKMICVCFEAFGNKRRL